MMRKKWLRGCGFFLLVAVLLCGLNALYVQSDYYQSIEGLWRYDAMPEDLQLVALGSSHGVYSFDFTLYPDYHSFNFAFAGQKPFFDFLLLERYQSHLGEGCVVVLPAFLGTWYGEGESLPARYYRILPPATVRGLPGYSPIDVFLYHTMPVFSSKKGLFDAFAPRTGQWTVTRSEAVTDTVHAQRDAEVYIQHFYVRRSRVRNETEWAAVRNILALCRQRGWQPVLVTAPIANTFYQAVPAGILEGLYADIEELRREYPELLFWDDAQADFLRYDDSLFWDLLHLNTRGQEVYTRAFVERLRREGRLLP